MIAALLGWFSSSLFGYASGSRYSPCPEAAVRMRHCIYLSAVLLSTMLQPCRHCRYPGGARQSLLRDDHTRYSEARLGVFFYSDYIDLQIVGKNVGTIIVFTS